ncbi:hypothetical protein K7I13_13740 [Brucepastera parasyntrophica]|uniref:hypothetical protein n=1 Tax=Brucepastera parasyntrophica TaxID=2880008 RepID=UPI00210A9F70|nr:hypothetical protein [Brucepastera parasyntrophica]ULQ59513.1 hypothetical protein K7I13_13740 [Brucepastera parasyntrophica]
MPVKIKLSTVIFWTLIIAFLVGGFIYWSKGGYEARVQRSMENLLDLPHDDTPVSPPVDTEIFPENEQVVPEGEEFYQEPF